MATKRDAKYKRQNDLDALLLLESSRGREEAKREALQQKLIYIQARLNAIRSCLDKFNKKKGALCNERYKKLIRLWGGGGGGVAIGSEEDERAIKKMNEKDADKRKKRRMNLFMRNSRGRRSKEKEVRHKEEVKAKGECMAPVSQEKMMIEDSLRNT
ncbi:hypothetical protein Tco_0511907 [Tanacetum coccineum]